MIKGDVRALSRGPIQTPAQTLRALADDVGDDAEADSYGTGAIVEDLERRVAELLGKEAALFSISGRTVQLAALRVHADARGRRAFVAHPRSHIVEDENDAASTLFGLRAVRTGSLFEPFTREDVRAVTEPLGSVTVELPLRRAGFRVPAWDELGAIATLAHERGAAFHLDGARLWETAPGYGRPLAEIAALADTVYVSFYKGLGGLAGAALAGDAETIAAARVWIARAGCVLFRAFPYVAAARAGLERRLPLIPQYYERCRAFVAALRGIDGIVASPDPPAGTYFVVYASGSREALLAARDAVAESEGISLFSSLIATPHPDVFAFEVAVEDNALTIEPADVRRAFEIFAQRSRAGGMVT